MDSKNNIPNNINNNNNIHNSNNNNNDNRKKINDLLYERFHTPNQLIQNMKIKEMEICEKRKLEKKKFDSTIKFKGTLNKDKNECFFNYIF